MNHQHMEPSSVGLYEWILPFMLVLLISVLYVCAVHFSNRQRRLSKWPVIRSILWSFGVLCAITAISGPLADRAHMDFNYHMITHLLLGMLAPLLIALSAPVTLFLRTVSTPFARMMTRITKSRVVRFSFHPVVASILNLGGLWLLYTTNLYAMMHYNTLWHVVIHMHIFLAGYLFTVSMIYVDLVHHRFNFPFRAIIFVLFLAGHGILSKYIYANPPADVETAQAQSGGMLMYYGGDAIDLVLIFIFCWQWYRAARPKEALIARETSSDL